MTKSASRPKQPKADTDSERRGRTTLDAWLSWQETLHPEEIELGLERIRRVAGQLDLLHPEATVVTVAGTNGKGSSIAILESIALAAGMRVGSYTSPHLLRYNERIQINGEAVSDEQLCSAFERVDRARGEVSLTYFEFGTLAALEIFEGERLDLMLLEVGLGGRLDAVNIIDADVALVTTVDLDHQAWLGESREEIGREKAGIFRGGRVAVVGELDPPASVVEVADSVEAALSRAGVDFSFVESGGEWSWSSADGSRMDHLPLPTLPGSVQLQNSAAALEVIHQLGWLELVGEEAIRNGLRGAELLGRFQTIAHNPEVIVDVSHNRQAAATLAGNLSSTAIQGRTIAVVGMLRDKEVGAVVEQLDPEVDLWIAAGLDVARGLSSMELEQVIRSTLKDREVHSYETVTQAYEAARKIAREEERILLFGSFYTVAAVLGGQ